jgi:hypothetical protein
MLPMVNFEPIMLWEEESSDSNEIVICMLASTLNLTIILCGSRSAEYNPNASAPLKLLFNPGHYEVVY